MSIEPPWHRENDPIDPDYFDSDLLAACVLREVNLHRARVSLGKLCNEPLLHRAAWAQVCAMVEGRYLGHGQLNCANATPWDRVKYVGLQPSYVSENVALSFVLQYENDRLFSLRTEEGRNIFSYEPNGPALPPHSYLSFSRALLTQWMDSPGHRENILAPQPVAHGVAFAKDQRHSMIPCFYVAQVFYAPEQC